MTMNIKGNTILITGGTSGIGRALAEALQKEGNQVIIAGRRKELLTQVVAANPGMKSAELNVEDLRGLKDFAAKISTEYPTLNVLINNAGIMKAENLLEPGADFSAAESTVTTNLLAPIELTALLLPTLKKQSGATVMTVTSGLAYIPMATTPTYCATKAAIHSWTQSLRYQLKGTNVQVMELVPPYVQTELLGKHQLSDPNAMPLAEFISEVIGILKSQPDAREVLVQRVLPLRFSAEDAQKQAGYQKFFEEFNTRVASQAAGH